MPRPPVPPDAPDAREIAPLLGLAVGALDGALSPRARADGEAGAARLLARVRRRRRLRRGGAATLGLALAAAAAALVVRPARAPRAPASLHIVASSGGLAAGGYVGGGARRRVTAFSDGSRVTYEPGARGRILSVDARGARIAVEEGTADVAVRPRAGAAWTVHAGPFVVDVTGTAFAITWAPRDERFALDLRSGAVRVRGPLAAGLEMRAGQTLRVALREGRVELREAGTDQGPGGGAGPGAAAPAVAPVVVPLVPRAAAPIVETPVRPAPRARPPARTAPRPGAPVSSPGPAAWPERLAAGEFDAILADAERLGVSEVIDRAPRAALAALADAARYRRRPELARRALAAQLARFPGSVEAEQALFFLGRMAEQEGDTGAALADYDRYLARAPRGSYAAEALGRKLLLVERRDGAARARPLAEAYLARFPGGAYAKAARKLLGRP